MKTANTIYCFDLDGTLVQKGKIHPLDVETLLNPGHDIYIPATGRPLHSIIELFKMNGIPEHWFSSRPLIAHNGSMAYLDKQEPFFIRTFESSTLKMLFDLIQAFSHLSWILVSSNGMFCPRLDPDISNFAGKYQQPVNLLEAKHADCPFTKIMIISHSGTLDDNLQEALKQLPVNMFRSLPYLYEILPFNTSKRTGLNQLIQALGIPKENPLLVAGDAENDLELLAASPYSFAPESAMETVKEKARFIIDPLPRGLFAAMRQTYEKLKPADSR